MSGGGVSLTLALALDELITRVTDMDWLCVVRLQLVGLGEALQVPECERCEMPIWTPVAVLWCSWRGRRYHYLCLKAELGVSDAARWTPDLMDEP